MRTLVAVLLATMTTAVVLVAQSSSSEAVQSWPIRENVFMLVGPGANTTLHIGRDGVLVVDPQTSAAAGPLLAAIRRLSDKPVRFIVNTTIDSDHNSGHEALARSGKVLEGGNTRPATGTGPGGAPIFAHANLLNGLSDSTSVSSLVFFSSLSES